MKVKSVLVLALSGFAISQAALAYCVNKDLKNLGPTAHDLAVILGGTQTVTSHFDGYTAGPKAGKFATVGIGPSGPNTMIHWQNLNGVNGAIPNGKVIHVGWCTTRQSNVLNMYWTDRTGRPIPGSVVYNITSRWRYVNNFVRAVFRNEFASGAAITISGLSWGAFSTEWPLDQLNAENQVLNDQLHPVAGPSTFSVAPGSEIEVPLAELPVGQTVVLRYAVHGPGSSAEALDFVQFVVGPDQ